LKKKRILFATIALVLLAVMSYSGHQLLEINRGNAQQAQLHHQLIAYRPALPDFFEPDTDRTNQSILHLQAQFQDVVGWLTIPGTGVDYPFVQGRNNDEYLHLDLNQRWSAAGTVFMDYRNQSDFSDFNTILFGHHMRNGTMFGTLQHFNHRDFFQRNERGLLFLANQTYAIDFMAFAVISPYDAIVYNPVISTDEEKLAFLQHVENIARHYRDIGVTVHDRVVVLSTCNYEFDDARMVLIGKLTAFSA